MQHNQLKCRPRRAQRGAIMVEGLIIVCLLAVFFAVGIFIAVCHASKAAAAADATAHGWQTAVQGCGNVQTKYDIERVLATQTGAPDAPDPAFLGENQVFEQNSSKSVTAPSLIGGGQWSMAAAVHVTCNEIPLSGNDALSAIDAFGWAATGAVHAAGIR
jgi:hypothetical protein